MLTASLTTPVFESSASVPSLVWRSSSAGAVLVARLEGRDVAGISGPWDGQYALTWWARPSCQRCMDLFDSREEAQAAVEAWARRMLWSEPPVFVSRLLETWDEEGREVTSAALDEPRLPRTPAWRRWLRLRFIRPNWLSMGTPPQRLLSRYAPLEV